MSSEDATAGAQNTAQEPPVQQGSANGASAPVVTVHHLNRSRSQRILWLLEELEAPYEIKHYERTPMQLAPKELLNVHPLGKSPVITDGDVTLAESGAIVEYIISKYGKGKAQPTKAGELDNLYFVHYSEGTLMPLVVNKYIFKLIPDHSPFFLRPLLRPVFAAIDQRRLAPEMKKNLEYVEAHLAKAGKWFAGGEEPTAADYMMEFPLDRLLLHLPDLLGPKTKEWVARVHERPAYKRALDKGGESK